jgi:hypothetical protein
VLTELDAPERLVADDDAAFAGGHRRIGKLHRIDDTAQVARDREGDDLAGLARQLRHAPRRHVQPIHLERPVVVPRPKHDRARTGPPHVLQRGFAVVVVLPCAQGEQGLRRTLSSGRKTLRSHIQQQDLVAVFVGADVGLARDDEGVRPVRRHLLAQFIGVVVARLDDASELHHLLHPRPRKICSTDRRRAAQPYAEGPQQHPAPACRHRCRHLRPRSGDGPGAPSVHGMAFVKDPGRTAAHASDPRVPLPVEGELHAAIAAAPVGLRHVVVGQGRDVLWLPVQQVGHRE